MKKSLILVFLFLLPFISVEAGERKPYEMPRTQVTTIKNSETGELDKLYIKLPKGYEENKDTKYPVIYFTDPVMHIEILSAATELMMENVILVGITWQKGMTLKFEHVDSYLNFLRKDVIKTIENSYRTDPDSRTYFGYSAGALVGAYILSAQSDTFKNYILGSPAFGNGPEVTQNVFELESNADKKRKNLNANVFISYGTLENNKHFEEFITMLKNKSDKSLSLKHVVVEGDHSTAFPMTGVRSVQWLSQMNNFSVLEGPYLGQKPPGLIPELFAPDIIQTEHREAEAAFTPDLKEFYFRRRGGEYKNNTLVVIQYKDNRWTESVVPPRAGEPFISPDGKILYLGNKYRDRTSSGWSEVKSLDAPFKDIPIMRLTVSSKGTYYFDEATKIGNIRYSRLIDGKREKPRTLNKDIDMGKWKAHPFIAPDESYLIW
ncbi:MAG: hypothetical protein JKY19_02425, partial [Alcanivoracaceae bacterium]|nr:hypothetical protein [Alcanivoracaceae bacterium]